MTNESTKKNIRKPSRKLKAKNTNEKPRPIVEDVVASKLMRDHVIKERVYLGYRMQIVMGLALIISIIANVVLALRPNDVKYFATNGEGAILSITALDVPLHSTSVVLNWATQSITKAYTFSFSNYRAQLQDSRDVFTGKGWEGFQLALEESGNLRTVIDNKLVTTAVPRGAPIIIAEGQLGGNYAWKIQLPMLVTYQSASTRTTQDLLVSAIISRRSELEHPMGLGVAQIIAQ
jgi:intracellular multiplication protein IcmL